MFDFGMCWTSYGAEYFINTQFMSGYDGFKYYDRWKKFGIFSLKAIGSGFYGY